MTNAPKLAYNDWQFIDETTLVAWINDLQFFDIHLGRDGTLELRFNDVTLGTTLYLGDSDAVGQAIVRARRYLDSKEPS